MLRKTYAVVDLKAIAHNIGELRRMAGTDVMAVVKGNAYGHGMIPVAKKAMSVGVNWFAVATPDEAVELRAHCDKNILLLSPADKESAYEMVKRDISLCAFSKEQFEDIADACEKTGLQAKIHLKIDTGMNRIGLRGEDELLVALDFLKEHSELMLEGAFTHFSTADESDKTFSNLQISRYKEAMDIIKEEGFSPIFHASNSAAIIDLPEAHFDMCRMGISMYGYLPSDYVRTDRVHLIPALTLVSHVMQIKTIHAGDFVGYGRKFMAEQDEEIATLPIGYCDGYRRVLGGKAYAMTGVHRIQQVGGVCMDQIMFRVTGLHVKVGDEVVLIGPGVSARDLADLAGMLHYELLTCISDRVPRVYTSV